MSQTVIFLEVRGLLCLDKLKGTGRRGDEKGRACSARGQRNRFCIERGRGMEEGRGSESMKLRGNGKVSDQLGV